MILKTLRSATGDAICLEELADLIEGRAQACVDDGTEQFELTWDHDYQCDGPIETAKICFIVDIEPHKIFVGIPWDILPPVDLEDGQMRELRIALTEGADFNPRVWTAWKVAGLIPNSDRLLVALEWDDQSESNESVWIDLRRRRLG